MTSAERARVEQFGQLENGLRQAGDWYLWGPYLSERQWGTVREDYSADGDAWAYLPHDHARSRAYRWGEDGMAGFSDVEQRLCLGLALWNGRDPILKERMFGLTGAEANHGEDVKEHWWYLDAVPSHAWNRWRYHYPQRAFPYDDLRAENGRRGKLDPEYELLDTGVFDDDRYWICEVDYVKADPTDLLMTVRVTNAGPERRHAARAADGVVPQHVVVGRRRREAGAARRTPPARSWSTTRSSASWSCSPARPRRVPTRSRCSATTRPTRARLFGDDDGPRVPEGRHQRPRRRRRDSVNPQLAGHQGVAVVPGCRSIPARPSSCACVCARRAPSRRRRSSGARARTSTRSSPSAARRPTSSTPS